MHTLSASCFSLLAFYAGFYCETAQAAPSVPTGLRVERSDIVISKDAADTSGTLTICNTTQSSIALHLALSDFITANGIRRTPALKAVPSNRPISGRALAASECVAVQVVVSGLEQVAAASAQLKNGTQQLGTVTLVRDRVAYSLTVDGIPSDKPEVRLFRFMAEGFFQQKESRIFIKNSDAWAYGFRLNIDIDGRFCETEPPKDTLVIQPNSSLAVYLKCDESLFNWFTTGFLKSDTRAAQVSVSVLGPEMGSILARKRLPVSAVLSYSPDWFQLYANGFWSIGILICGALLSVFITIVLPNYGRCIELRRRLAPMGKALQPASEVLGLESSQPNADHERARVLLKLEWRRLKDILNAIWSFSMNAGVMLDEVQAKTDLLEKKVALFCRVDAALLATVDFNAGHLPPSVLDRVNLNCATGVTFLLRDSLTPDELTQLAALITESETLLADSGQPLDWLEKNIATVEASVRKVLCGDDESLREPVPEPWSSLCGDLLAEVPKMADTPFFPSQYAVRDRRAILFTYVQRYAALKALTAGARSDRRRNPAEEEFETACKQRPVDLMRARRFIDQMESGASPQDLIHEILEQNVQICPPKATVPCFSPIKFQVIFPRTPRFNTTPAKRQIGVHWDFGDGSEAEGWEIWHYFPRRGERYNISVQFSDRHVCQKGVLISDERDVVSEQDKIVPVTIRTIAIAERQPEHLINQSKSVDILRFVLAVLTAAFALSGVRQILPTADALSATIGALALGFSADTFKNLITSRK
jgi:hypothetical protein